MSKKAYSEQEREQIKHDCDPKVFGNLCLSMVLIHNSAERALPFFFTDRLEETAETNARILVQYVASLRQ